MANRIIETKKAPSAIGPYSQGVVANGFLFCSGQIALEPESGTMVGGDDVAAQAERALRNLEAVVEAAGTTLAQVVRTTIYLIDMNDFAPVNEVYRKFFSGSPPARACVAVSALPKAARVEIDAIATIPS